jgi:hypothetical protein
MLRVFSIVAVVLALLVSAWIWLALTFSYSEGERAGYIQKISSKGWLCKTWEGEIAMVTMPGAIPDRFAFTVRDEAVVKKINALTGQRVVLIYQQHKFLPTQCFGETEYFVIDVRAVGEQPLSPAPVVLAPPLAPAAPPAPAKP